MINYIKKYYVQTLILGVLLLLSTLGIAWFFNNYSPLVGTIFVAFVVLVSLFVLFANTHTEATENIRPFDFPSYFKFAGSIIAFASLACLLAYLLYSFKDGIT